MWPPIAYKLNDTKREDFFGTFAPFFLVCLLVAWVTMLVLGWGLFFYGIRDQMRPSNLSFSSAVYYAGSSLLTIGYGDILAHTPLARVASLVCAASGLGVVAIVISFLFAVFASFQQRERFVVTIGARAGVPPSGLGLLEVQAHAGIGSDLAPIFREGQQWTAAVMETHLAYPVLIMFRSSHDYESWVGTLGTLLDASLLVMSTLDPEHTADPQTQGQARIMYDLGKHLVRDFASTFLIPDSQSTGSGAGIERFEFDQAREKLSAAGYRIRGGADACWADFSQLRAAYAPELNALARFLEIPPIQWVGDRSLVERQRAHVS
jgi:hypothetical protein